jgi:ubiquinone biosynthesis protein COQ4
MAGLGAVFGPLRLDAAKRARLFREYVPWALRCGANAKPLIAVYWEERWESNVDDMKKELGIWDPPAAIWGKTLSEAEKARKKRQSQAANQTAAPSS